MEFEDVSEEIEWEARRVAAAFGVENGKKLELWRATLWLKSVFHDHSNAVLFYGQQRKQNQLKVEWCINFAGQVTDICVGKSGTLDCVVKCRYKLWYKRNTYSNYAFHVPMVCGLYRLGIEDESVLDSLNYSLSAHEKLELRLSMPREFWPKTWLDEEGESASPPGIAASCIPNSDDYDRAGSEAVRGEAGANMEWGAKAEAGKTETQ